MRNPFAAIFGRNQRENAPAQQTQPAQGSPSRGPRYGTPGLMSVCSSYQAMQVSTVYRCVQIIGNTIASLPIHYLRRDADGIFRPDLSSRHQYLLNLQPNEDYNAFDFWDTALRYVLLNGDAYIVPIYSLTELGEVSYYVLCNSNAVSYDSLNRVYNINDADNGISGVFAENEIIHLKGLSLDGKRGVSVISFAKAAMDIQATGDAETLNRFANGGNIRGMISNDTSVRGFGEYADSELQKTAIDIDDRLRGGQRIVSIPGQAQFTQFSMSSVDLEFLNSRKFGVREICRFFGVPPTFVFDDTSNNYKSAEMANISFFSQTINPLLKKIELELNRKLIAPARFGRYKFEFDRRGLYTADLITKADYQQKTIASGVYSINDWRRYENQPDVDNGDKVLVSANLKGLNQLIAENIKKNGQE